MTDKPNLDPLYTMEEVAEALRLPISTLYQYIAYLEAEHPDVAWYRKQGRHRRFSREDYDRLKEALWPSRLSPEDSKRGTGTTSPAAWSNDSRSRLSAATRTAKRRKTKLLLRNL